MIPAAFWADVQPVLLVRVPLAEDGRHAMVNVAAIASVHPTGYAPVSTVLTLTNGREFEVETTPAAFIELLDQALRDVVESQASLDEDDAADRPAPVAGGPPLQGRTIVVGSTRHAAESWCRAHDLPPYGARTLVLPNRSTTAVHGLVVRAEDKVVYLDPVDRRLRAVVERAVRKGQQ